MGYLASETKESATDKLLSDGSYHLPVKPREMGACTLRVGAGFSETFNKPDKRKPVYVTLAGVMSSLPVTFPTPASDAATAMHGCSSRAARAKDPASEDDIKLFYLWSVRQRRLMKEKGRAKILDLGFEHDAERWIARMARVKGAGFADRLRTKLHKHSLWDPFVLLTGILDMSENGKTQNWENYDMFQKVEMYAEVTATRIIFSVNDFLRIVHGDVCKAVGNLLVHNEFTVCGTSAKKWARIVWERFDGVAQNTWGSDFKAFESFFRRSIKIIVDYLPYFGVAALDPRAIVRLRHMMDSERNTTSKHRHFTFGTYLDNQRSGSHKTYDVNTCGHILLAQFCYWVATGKDMPTSLMMEAVSAAQADVNVFPMIVAGDDGIAAVGSEVTHHMNHEITTNLGVGLKVETLSHNTGLETVGSAFLKTEPIVTSRGIRNGTDLWEALCKLRWAKAKFIRAKDSKLASMIKAKMLSYLYRLRSTPVISALCVKYLYLWRSLDERYALKHLDQWHGKKLLDALEDARSLSQGRTRFRGDGTHVMYTHPEPEEFAYMAQREGIPVDVLRRVHYGLIANTVHDECRDEPLMYLRPFAPRDYTFVWDKYVTSLTAWESGAWVEPEPAFDLIGELRNIVETENSKFELRIKTLERFSSCASLRRSVVTATATSCQG